MTQENSDKLKLLYEIYEQPMYRIAYAVLHDEGLAEDAVSEAFIRLIPQLHKIGECQSNRTKNYIIKVIKSTSINTYRRNKKRFSSELPIDDAMHITDYSQISDRKAYVNEIMGNLSEPDRSIIVMRCIKQMPWREIAKNLSITESNARKRFERMKKRLKMKGEISDE